MKSAAAPAKGRRGCGARTRHGSLCPAAAIKGTDRCLLHTSGVAHGMGQVGGARRKQYDVSKLEKFAPPRDAADMRKVLATMVIEMRSGAIDPGLATKIAFVCGVFLKAAENEVIEKVVAELDALKQKVYGTRGAKP